MRENGDGDELSPSCDDALTLSRRFHQIWNPNHEKSADNREEHDERRHELASHVEDVVVDVCYDRRPM